MMAAESTRIEYKEVLTKDLDLEKEVIAFLNYNEGGVIYIGINKQGESVGVDDIDGDMLKIKDRIKHNISPSAMGLFTVESEEQQGRNIIKITVASGSEKPYFRSKYGMSPKGTFIRIGTASEPMEQSMIDNLFSRRVRNSIGRIKSNRQDLTFSQLRIYYDEKGKTLNENFKRSLELVTDEDRYNYVAYLMADENNNSVKVARFSSLDKSDIEESKEYGYCSLIKIVNRVLDRLEIENSVSTTITYPNRIDTPKWNNKALREAVINAFVHNDYTYELSPTFEIYPNRLEIRSFGRLPDTMSSEEFFTGTSMPKNKELMRIFNDLELVESLGYGIPRIVGVYGRECFHFSDNFVKMVLPVAGYDGNQDTPQDSNQVGNQASNQVSNQDKTLIDSILHEFLREIPDSPEQRKRIEYYLSIIPKESEEILQFCLDSPMSKGDIFKKLGITSQKKNSDKYLQPLIENDMIRQTIKARPTSPLQKYSITSLGREVVAYLKRVKGE